MSDPNLTIQRQIQALQDGHERLRKADVPALYLPWSQRILNPFPLASSGSTWGDCPQPWNNVPLAFYVSVDVLTTNNGTNFWTIELFSFTAAAGSNLVASVNTSGLTANVPARLSDTTVTAPGSTDVSYFIKATATLSPGSIFIFPALALLRTGN